MISHYQPVRFLQIDNFDYWASLIKHFIIHSSSRQGSRSFKRSKKYKLIGNFSQFITEVYYFTSQLFSRNRRLNDLDFSKKTYQVYLLKALFLPRPVKIHFADILFQKTEPKTSIEFGSTWCQGYKGRNDFLITRFVYRYSTGKRKHIFVTSLYIYCKTDSPVV